MTISPVCAYPAYCSPVACGYNIPAQNAPQIHTEKEFIPTSYGVPIHPQMAACAASMQIQPSVNISSIAKGEPDLVCKAQYNAMEKSLHISSIERGWLDSNIWHTVNADGSGETISAWGQALMYPAGTFTSVFNKAQEIYYTQGEISESEALSLAKDIRAAASIARQNGTEISERVMF